MIRVLIADDQPLIRTGFRLMLDAQPDMEVVGEAADGAEAVQLARLEQADVVLMDIRMPRLDGVTATGLIVQQEPATRVLVLTTFDLDVYAFGSLRAGASGFLLKDIGSLQLLEAIRSVATGDAVVSPRITRRMLEIFAPHLPDSAKQSVDPTAVLTSREREVFLAMARGRSNPEIGEDLHLTESTVKTHVGRVLSKLGLRDRVHAVILAYEHDLIERAG